jgi:hypothetical protein
VVPARLRLSSLGSHRERIPQRRMEKLVEWSGVTAFTHADGIKKINIFGF